MSLMPSNAKPFERSLMLADGSTFAELTAGIIGQQCRRVDKLYGGAFSLHFGEWLPPTSVKARNRGSWVVTAWGCDARVETSRGSVADDRTDERERVIMNACDLENSELEQIDFDPGAATLRLRFDGGAIVDLFFDPDYNGDAWIISLPSRQTIAVTAGRRWSLEEDQRSSKLGHP